MDPSSGGQEPDGSAGREHDRSGERRSRGSALADFPVPWSGWAVVLVYVLQFVFVGLVAVLLSGLAVADPAMANVILLPVTSIATAVFTFLVVWGRYPGQVWRLRGPRRPRPTDLGWGVAYGLGGYVLTNVVVGTLLQIALTAAGRDIPVVQQMFREFAADPDAAPIFLVGAILLAPLGEELAYRGLLFAALRSRFGRLAGILGSAAVFGAVHIDPTASIEAAILVFVPITTLACLLAWAYDRSGSIAVPIVAHCTYNAVNAVLLVTLQM